MHSVTQNEDGYVTLDNACVRCGQCVPDCPGQARILRALPEYPELPEDYVDTNIFFAKDRLQRGQLVDFTDSTLEVE
jgi:ferredoxin